MTNLKQLKMRILTIYLMTSLTIISCNFVDKSNTYDNSLEYVGQKKPGLELELFAPGIISTAFHDVRISFTPDLLECYFYTVYKPNDTTYKWTTLTSKYEDGHWTLPDVAFFSGIYNDHAPCIHPNGSIFIYQSDRPLPNSNNECKWNFWIMYNKNGKWTEPKPMDSLINGCGNVYGPSLAANGNLYFTRELDDESQVIMRSKFVNGNYLEPEILPKEINSVKSQFDAAIAPDESYMIVPVYGRDDTQGSTDYYISFSNQKDQWSNLINLGPKINTKQVESGPYISPDGKYIFLQSYGFNNGVTQEHKPIKYSDMLLMLKSSDIYWIDAQIIEQYRPKNFN